MEKQDKEAVERIKQVAKEKGTKAGQEQFKKEILKILLG